MKDWGPILVLLVVLFLVIVLMGRCGEEDDPGDEYPVEPIPE